jgi:Transposase DDE domain
MDGYSSTEDFIIDLFCRIDTAMANRHKHPQSLLWPGEIVTLAVLFVLKGRSERAFYRWARRDLLKLFPKLPERTRLFRLFAVHQDWAIQFLAWPTFFGVADSFGIELLQTRRLGRSPQQIAARGFCGGRWIAGIKLGWVINSAGQVCAWDVATANVYDANAFAPLIDRFREQMIVLADCNFHKSPFHRRNDPDPPNLKVCPRHAWNHRRLIETVLSMLQAVCSLKRLTERAWRNLRAHLAFVGAAFNLLTSWDGATRMSLARFSL